MHVIAADRDRVELRHLGRAIADDVGDDPHRGRGRVDVGVADRELFQNVVLDRSRELRVRDALLFSGNDEEGHDRKNRAVHGHADRHLVQGDAVEQKLHVLDGVDRDARHPDVAGDARIIAVVAAMGGKIECDREALLSCGEVTAIESVGLFGGREAGILPDRPRPTGVHCRIGPAREWSEAGEAIVDVLDVIRAIDSVELDRFEGL